MQLLLSEELKLEKTNYFSDLKLSLKVFNIQNCQDLDNVLARFEPTKLCPSELTDDQRYFCKTRLQNIFRNRTLAGRQGAPNGTRIHLLCASTSRRSTAPSSTRRNVTRAWPTTTGQRTARRGVSQTRQERHTASQPPNQM